MPWKMRVKKFSESIIRSFLLQSQFINIYNMLAVSDKVLYFTPALRKGLVLIEIKLKMCASNVLYRTKLRLL